MVADPTSRMTWAIAMGKRILRWFCDPPKTKKKMPKGPQKFEPALCKGERTRAPAQKKFYFKNKSHQGEPLLARSLHEAEIKEKQRPLNRRQRRLRRLQMASRKRRVAMAAPLRGGLKKAKPMVCDNRYMHRKPDRHSVKRMRDGTRKTTRRPPSRRPKGRDWKFDACLGYPGEGPEEMEYRLCKTVATCVPSGRKHFHRVKTGGKFSHAQRRVEGKRTPKYALCPLRGECKQPEHSHGSKKGSAGSGPKSTLGGSANAKVWFAYGDHSQIAPSGAGSVRELSRNCGARATDVDEREEVKRPEPEREHQIITTVSPGFKTTFTRCPESKEFEVKEQAPKKPEQMVKKNVVPGDPRGTPLLYEDEVATDPDIPQLSEERKAELTAMYSKESILARRTRVQIGVNPLHLKNGEEEQFGLCAGISHALQNWKFRLIFWRTAETRVHNLTRYATVGRLNNREELKEMTRSSKVGWFSTATKRVRDVTADYRSEMYTHVVDTYMCEHLLSRLKQSRCTTKPFYHYTRKEVHKLAWQWVMRAVELDNELLFVMTRTLGFDILVSTMMFYVNTLAIRDYRGNMVGPAAPPQENTNMASSKTSPRTPGLTGFTTLSAMR